MVNLYQRILEENAGYEGVAVCDRGRMITYPELFKSVDFIVDRLRKAGVDTGSRVAILADDSMEYIAVSLAVLALECIVVPFSTCAPENEVRNMLSEMGVNVMLCSEKYHREEDSSMMVPESFQDDFYLRFLTGKIQPVPLPDNKQAAFIRFSSGTTGNHKGVVLSHESMIERTDACQELGVTRGEKIFWVLDMAFHFAVTILLFLRKGACIVICPPPVEANMAQVLKEHEVNLLYATPYHYRLMTSSEEITPDMLRGVRRAFSTAMKLESPDAIAFREKFALPLTQAYGIIEVGLPCINVSDRPDKVNSVGCVQSAYQLRLADADESGAGRVLLKGPGFFDAYLTPYKLRSEICDDDCYFSTGDIGRMDDDGYLYLIGRVKNVINFAGMKVFPSEIETVLRDHPWVRECRVTGQVAGAFGEVPVAEIVVAADTVLIDGWEDALREFCCRQLAPYKVPKMFRQVESLPRTAGGRNIRRS